MTRWWWAGAWVMRCQVLRLGASSSLKLQLFDLDSSTNIIACYAAEADHHYLSHPLFWHTFDGVLRL
tara:strand:- start:11958 stop:12158 length:201 start_codon:yes stop_codon:yes gene_type:complete